MKRGGPVALLLALCAAGMIMAQEEGMKITSAAPGNLFGARSPVAFTVTAPGRAVSYEVLDYYGQQVAHREAPVKEGSARIALGRLPLGHYRLLCRPASRSAYSAEAASATQAAEASLRRASGQEVTTSFAVIRGRRRQAASERIAVDGATAWLCKPEQWEPVAKMLRRAGIGWVRERLSWGGVQPKDEGFQWDRYETVASALAGQGVHVYQIFHDSPGWTHPGDERTRCPDDLRTVYRFARAAGEHFKGRILAWEPWNEPDISFFPDLADRYAGVQKAAYLGFKAADPELMVLSCSLCAGPGGFAHNLFECGIADYYDIFNYHVYANPKDYPRLIKGYLDLAAQYGCGDRPGWLTEAGIHLKHEQGELSWESQQRQAEFAPRSIVMSLASGTDRHFFFVLPHYVEGEIQFGALHADLTPRPAFAAVAAAADILGEAKYLGRYELEGVEAHAFDTGKQIVLVTWADEEREASLPVGKSEVQVADLLGRRLSVTTSKGTLRLTVGPAAQYIVGVGGDLTKELTGTLRVGRLPENEPSLVIIAGHLALPFDKGGNFYRASSATPVSLTVDVYNFAEAGEAEVTLTASDEAGWAIAPAEATVKVAPMGRQTVQFTVRPTQDDNLHKLWVRGKVDGRPIPPSVSWVRW